MHEPVATDELRPLHVVFRFLRVQEVLGDHDRVVLRLHLPHLTAQDVGTRRRDDLHGRTPGAK